MPDDDGLGEDPSASLYRRRENGSEGILSVLCKVLGCGEEKVLDWDPCDMGLIGLEELLKSLLVDAA